jgi:CRP/FNR family transcriptional regulator, cyclic AMP receptor protein
MAKEKTSEWSNAIAEIGNRLVLRFKQDSQNLVKNETNDVLLKDPTVRADSFHFHIRLTQCFAKALATGQLEELNKLCDAQGRLMARYGYNLSEVVRRSATCIEAMVQVALEEIEKDDHYLVNPRFFHACVNQLNHMQSQLSVAIIAGYTEQQETGMVWPFVLPENAKINAKPNINLILSQINAITSEYTLARFRAGTTIFHDAEPQRTRFYFVREGTVQLQEFLADGRALTLTILGKGDVFARFTRNEPGHYFREFQAETMRDSEIIVIEEGALERAMHRSPLVATAIIRSFSVQLASVHRLIQGLLGRDVSVRLAHLLLKLTDQFGISQPDKSILINYSLSHQQIADMMGSNRVTITRQLSELQKLGILEIRRRSITVYNRSALEKLAFS